LGLKDNKAAMAAIIKDPIPKKAVKVAPEVPKRLKQDLVPLVAR
jgi:hypothetical protein